MSRTGDSMDFNEVKNIVLATGNIGREVSAASGAARLACMDIAYSLFALTDFGRAAETARMKVDLPALGRPTTAMRKGLVMSSSVPSSSSSKIFSSSMSSSSSAMRYSSGMAARIAS